MSDPKELNELVDIGLVTKVSGIFPLGNREGDQAETAAIRLQMESLSGKIYFASHFTQGQRAGPATRSHKLALVANPVEHIFFWDRQLFS